MRNVRRKAKRPGGPRPAPSRRTGDGGGGRGRPGEGSEGGAHGIARWLSKLGFASRTVAARLVRAGRVTVGGRSVRDPERRTSPAESRSIAVDGRAVRLPGERTYLAMHKPAGVVTTFDDPQGRKTVYDVLPPEVAGGAWVFPVGRLDAKTSGLLLFTNDAALGEGLQNPETGLPHVEKRYELKVKGEVAPEALERLRRGVELDDGYRTRPAIACDVLRTSPGSTWLALTIVEGRNRQVRRMLEAVGHEVQKLRRTRIGPLELGDLASGATRPLTRGEVRALRRAAGLE